MHVAALHCRAVLAHAGLADADLAQSWLAYGLAVASRRTYRWPPAQPVASHFAPTAAAATLPIYCPTRCCTAAVLLPSLPCAMAQSLPLLLASPRNGLVLAAGAIASPFMAPRPHMSCSVVGVRMFPLVMMAHGTCTCANPLVASHATPR